MGKYTSYSNAVQHNQVRLFSQQTPPAEYQETHSPFLREKMEQGQGYNDAIANKLISFLRFITTCKTCNLKDLSDVFLNSNTLVCLSLSTGTRLRWFSIATSSPFGKKIHYHFCDSTHGWTNDVVELQSTPDNSNLQGKSKKGPSYWEFEL